MISFWTSTDKKLAWAPCRLDWIWIINNITQFGKLSSSSTIPFTQHSWWIDLASTRSLGIRYSPDYSHNTRSYPLRFYAPSPTLIYMIVILDVNKGIRSRPTTALYSLCKYID